MMLAATLDAFDKWFFLVADVDFFSELIFFYQTGRKI